MNHLKINIFSLFVVLFGLFSQFSSNAQSVTIPEKPSFIAPIMDLDNTGTLTEMQMQSIYEKLKNYSDSTSTELLVIIVKSTNGEEIGRYTTDLGHKWKIGQKGKDNGIVMLIAKDDRRVTIQAGYGTEHLLTDALSRRVIEQVITPEFKTGNYYSGIDKGTTAIMQIMSGEYKSDPKNNKEPGFGGIVMMLIFIVILIAIISKRKNGPGGGSGGLGTLADILILGSLGRSGGGGFGGGFGGGGGGGGGFGGFGGGGGVGGGGASGGW